MTTYISIEDRLKKYFKYTQFRTGQREIINDVLAGEDVLGILPTGTGKSLCYQLPAMILPGSTIIVSPLISLMDDQVKQLKAKQIKSVIALNGLMSFNERRRILKNLHHYKLIYISPELLQNESVQQALQKVTVSLFVIDEAHCISQWGHEFRPDYLKLAPLIKQLKNPPILALSATATPEVQNDIVTALNRQNMIKHLYPMDRENITLCIEKVNHEKDKEKTIDHLVKNFPVPMLIYFSSRVMAERIAKYLNERHPDRGIAYYHGGMDSIDRLSVQQQFMNDQLDVICCTSAFGMGIDKPNIRLIIHYHMPGQMESLIQEIGRAGRDGDHSVSVVLFGPNDDQLPRQMIENELPTETQLLLTLEKLQHLQQQNIIQLPMQEEEIHDLFSLTNTQWRFIQYQLEKRQIIHRQRLTIENIHWEQVYQELVHERNHRWHIKHEKLERMVDWIHTKTCLREALYLNFQTNYKKVNHCCTNCGFTWTEWKPKKHQFERSSKLSWDKLLKQLLLVNQPS